MIWQMIWGGIQVATGTTFWVLGAARLCPIYDAHNFRCRSKSHGFFANWLMNVMRQFFRTVFMKVEAIWFFAATVSFDSGVHDNRVQRRIANEISCRQGG